MTAAAKGNCGAGHDPTRISCEAATEIVRLRAELARVETLLARAEQALRALAKAVLVVAPTLKAPYPDAPGTSPWERFVHKPASAAYNLAAEIRVAAPSGEAETP